MNEDELLVGALRVYRFNLMPDDVVAVNNNIRLDLASSEHSDSGGIQVSNAGGYHSSTDLFTREIHSLLARVCSDAVRIAERHDLEASAGARIGPSSASDNVVRGLQPVGDAEGWVNRNRHGHWNSLHTHTGSTWSGIYYAKSALEVSSVAYSGSLLIKPSSHIKEAKALSSAEMKRLNTYAAGGKGGMGAASSEPVVGRCDYVEIVPESGMMLIFPSYLQHAVLPLCINKEQRSEDAGIRISFAFNFALSE
jgi:Putative 2OG-Fe(II) oxygenase